MAAPNPELRQLSDKVRQLEAATELLANKMQQMKHAQDTAAEQNAKMISSLQKIIARLEVNSNVNTFGNIIRTQIRDNALVNQLFTDAVVTKNEIIKSRTPLNVSEQFAKKWSDALKKAGIKIIA
jgi:hypothetical protein